MTMLKRTRDRGVTVLTAVILVVVVGGIASAFFLLALNESRVSEQTRYKARATYLAEAGVEIAAVALREACVAHPTIITLTPAPPSGQPLPWQSSYVMPPVDQGVPLNYPIPGVGGTVVIDGTPVVYNVFKRMPNNPTTDPASGLNTNVAGFEIMAYAKVGEDALKKYDVKAQEGIVYKMVETKGTPLFQFLAFYANELEINPGPFAHFHGRIHSNSDLYITDRDTSKGLILDTNYIDAAGKMFRTYGGGTYGSTPVETGATGPVWVRKTGTTPAGDAVENGNPASDPGLVPWDLGLNSNTAGWSTTAQSDWSGTVKDGQLGATKFSTPPVDSILPGGNFQQTAMVNGNLNITNTQQANGGYQAAVQQNGVDVTSAINSQQPGTITQSTIWDAREGKNVPVLKIDMGKLFQTSYYPQQGQIYVTDPGATSSSPSGVMLTNGSFIPTTGLGPSQTGTMPGLGVGSNLPVYIQGDFNGHTNTSGMNTKRQVLDVNGQPLVDNAGNPVFYTQSIDNRPGSPTQGQLIDTPPSMVMGDAVNLLSNSWNGTKNPTNGVPEAANTTYNLAIVSGNQKTTYDTSAPDSGYNGGLQNLPRFHEIWSGINCNIAGAFINLWQSQIATGKYGKGGVYTPPNRFWDYDQSFEKAGATPPGAPYATSIGRTTYEEGAVRSMFINGGGQVTGNPYDLLPQK
jgi:hypothetical protein